MNSIIIDTNRVTDDDYWEYADSVYCTNCKSCGDLGCECWSGCDALYCKYGDILLKQYEENNANSNRWYDMLIAIGIENPFDIDLERVKYIASETIDTATGDPVKDFINFGFNILKDMDNN